MTILATEIRSLLSPIGDNLPDYCSPPVAWETTWAGLVDPSSGPEPVQLSQTAEDPVSPPLTHRMLFLDVVVTSPLEIAFLPRTAMRTGLAAAATAAQMKNQQISHRRCCLRGLHPDSPRDLRKTCDSNDDGALSAVIPEPQ
uniref:Uncharacterized protein n=1 Tax=Rhodosorus marinus TaxID=101924 RepID=A0A7S3EHD1_9RHOD